MRSVDEPALTPWHPWEAIPVALATFSATLLVWVGVTAVAGAGETAKQVTGLAQQGLFAGLSVFWVAVRHRQGIASLGLRARRPAADLAVGAWFGAGLFVVAVYVILAAIVALWSMVIGGRPDPIEQPLLTDDPSLLHMLLGAVLAVIAAPIGEEIFFRGFLFGSLRGRLGFAAAAAISAAMFALVHGQPLLIAVMFFVGLALAWIYERRGSLLAPIGAHAMFNVIGYTLLLMERT